MIRMLKMCLNWRVLVGLAVAGLGIGLFVPGLLGRALPILLLAACPISMLVMMATMKQPTSQAPAPEDIDSLQAQLADLTGRQEQVRERLAHLASPQPNPKGVESRQ